MKHNATMYGPDESLARIDAIAAAALSGISTLTSFLSDLSEARGRTAVISRAGNGT